MAAERPAGRRPRRALRAWAAGLALIAATLAAPSCSTVPVTGRQAFNVYSIDQDVELGAQAYQQVKSTERIVASGPEAAMVERVMQRLVTVADDPGFQWEVSLLDAPETVNAFCLPGGKMAVYTGILPYTQDETGLAVVMGHEIAHAVARHGTERVTVEMGSQGALQLLNDAVGGDPQWWGLGKNLLLSLPYGRRQELEADHIGLIYMARAGYDPRQAVDFWTRMSQGKGGAPPEFLSTHPSDASRIERIESLLPEALREYDRTRSGR